MFFILCCGTTSVDFEFRDASFSHFKHLRASSISVSTASVPLQLSSETKLHILQKKQGLKKERKKNLLQTILLNLDRLWSFGCAEEQNSNEHKVNHCWIDAFLKSYSKERSNKPKQKENINAKDNALLLPGVHNKKASLSYHMSRLNVLLLNWIWGAKFPSYHQQ